VPGWHEATKKLQDEGKIAMVGIVEEQHPDRARLFMQWKQMTWPILVDSYDLLEVPYVPITLGIDEEGIIRWIPAFGEGPDKIGEMFLDPKKDPGTAAMDAPPVDPNAVLAEAQPWADVNPLVYAERLALFGGPAMLDEAIAAFRKGIKLDPGNGSAHFRLGVALRKREDSPMRKAGDFQAAVVEWQRALQIDPDNYIWRRRIQQYAARLDKPYPFYDWVVEARRDIEARGEAPVPLATEIGKAEVAAPASEVVPAPVPEKEPDPNGRITRDEGRFVEVEAVVVPPTIAPGESIRIHAIFRPVPAIKAHWNNEADDLVFWVDPPKGWRVDSRSSRVARPPEPVSLEERRVEVELTAPQGAPHGDVTIPSYALYYVCEDVGGTCLYRRQDVPFRVRIGVAGSWRPGR